MPTILEPKPAPKQTVSVRLSEKALSLLEKAVDETGKTQSSLVDECVILALTQAKKGTK